MSDNDVIIGTNPPTFFGGWLAALSPTAGDTSQDAAFPIMAIRENTAEQQRGDSVARRCKRPEGAKRNEAPKRQRRHEVKRKWR